ncbi:MAG: WD40/YVTN/BNR-like repeat-containing protein [Rhodomicrobiaceae bacterium]
MARKVLILLGTKKGAFIIEGGEDRQSWQLRGPFCAAWPITHVVGDPASGAIYAGGGNEWFGPAVWKTTDLGENWTHSSEGLAYDEGEEPVKAVWSFSQANGRLYAGVEPAGLFSSEDGGQSWQHVKGLRDHPTRPEWQPGGGGLILHSIVPHPGDDRKIWVGISTAGVFHTADGGESWEPRNRGTRMDYAPEDQRYPEFGRCVHCIVKAPGTDDRLYQQNHCGMYKSDDGGRSWDSIEAGLPSTFGFPAATHPRDRDTLYLVPLNGDSVGRYVPDGSAAVWRTRDAGANWEALREGLPQKDVYFGVLRQAMTTDSLEPAGVYFGSNTGELYVSADEGESWHCAAQHLPPISSVETLVVDA